MLPRDRLRLPLAPLALPDALERSDVLPVAPGALRGSNLLLVTLDTTRPDRLGCYGNAAIETPQLDGLAARGVLFSNAVATTSTTLPTHASILTGLYPHRHGARVNSLHALPDEAITLAERLSEHGYATAAFVSSFVLDAKFGLAQGFDHYDAEVAPATFGGYAERAADATTDAAIAWLRDADRSPFFVWVHYYDPHLPYAPPPAFGEGADNAYDAEIAFVDHELGRLLAAVGEAQGETLVAVTADHGEALGEGGELSHGLLVQEASLRIPLVLAASRGLPRGVRVDTRVSQVDLLPTLLSCLGVPAPAGLDGVDLGRPPEAGRELLAESVYGLAHYGWAPLAALYQGSEKFVDSPHPELYDLSRDPLERDDLAALRSGDVAALRARLRALRGEDADVLPEPTVALESYEIEQLRALGYVAGDPRAPQRRGAGPDPKRMLPLLTELLILVGSVDDYAKLSPLARGLKRLMGYPVASGPRDLIPQLEAFASEHPDFAPVYPFLRSFYESEGRDEDARRASERLRALVDASPG